MSTYKVLFVGSLRPPEPGFLVDAVQSPIAINLFHRSDPTLDLPEMVEKQYQKRVDGNCNLSNWSDFRESWRERAAQVGQFKAACYELARAFAEDRDFEVWTANVDWKDFYDGDTVTNYVLRGATSSNKKVVHFICPESPERPTKEQAEQQDKSLGIFSPEELSAPQVKQVPFADSSQHDRPSSVHIHLVPQLKTVDAVVLIGGSTATQIVGTAANAFGKPVIPITCFAGAAEQLATHQLFHEIEDLLRVEEEVRQDKQDEGADLFCLQEEWEQVSPNLIAPASPSEPPIISRLTDPADTPNHKHANNIVSITRKAIAARAHQDRQVANQLSQLRWWLGLAFVIWVGAYVLTAKVPCQSQLGSWTVPPAICLAGPWIVFYVLLVCAALLGSGLRTLLDYQKSATGLIALRNLWTEVTIAVVIAFGLSLLYFTGSLIYDSEGDLPQSFGNVALWMSLLGLTAGLTMPSETLKARLGEFIKLDPKAITVDK